MLWAIESGGKLAIINSDYLEESPSNWWGTVFTKIGIRNILEGKGSWSLQKLLPFVAEIIDQSWKCKKTPSKTVVHTRFSQDIANMKEDTRQWARGEGDLSSLSSRGYKLKK